MPITFSHPAAVVPLLGVGLVPSALVIGSITPDLPYYLPGPLTSARTHAASGIVTFDLVLGLLAFLVWHVLLAPTAVALAPAALRERLAPGLPVPAREYVPRWWLVLVSLAIGAATHVVWDSFSHPGRWGTDRIGWLREEHGPFMGYTWVQYGSGAVGFVVLAIGPRALVAAHAAHPGASARAGLGAARGAGLRRAGGGERHDRRRGRPAHR